MVDKLPPEPSSCPHLGEPGTLMIKAESATAQCGGTVFEVGVVVIGVPAG